MAAPRWPCPQGARRLEKGRHMHTGQRRHGGRASCAEAEGGATCPDWPLTTPATTVALVPSAPFLLAGE